MLRLKLPSRIAIFHIMYAKLVPIPELMNTMKNTE